MADRSMIAAVFVLVSTLTPPAALAQAPPEADVKALAKAAQNPVGDLRALPFQFNFNTGGDLEDKTFLNVNFSR